MALKGLLKKVFGLDKIQLRLEQAAARLDADEKAIQSLRSSIGNVNQNEPVSASVISQVFDSLSKNWDIQSAPDLITDLLKLAGYPVPHGFPDQYPHSLYLSRHNTYAPWHRETFFPEVLQKINPPFYKPLADSKSSQSYTLVDIHRIFSIYQCLESVRNIEGDCIEVGVYKGGTAVFTRAVLDQQDQASKLFLYDTFEGVVRAGTEDPCYVGGEHADTSIEGVRKLFESLDLYNNVQIVPGIFPDSVISSNTKDSSFNKIKFAHLDVDVYQGTLQSFNYIYPFMVKSGIVLVDDYATQGLEGVTKAVEEIKSNYDVSLFHMFNGQAMIVIN